MENIKIVGFDLDGTLYPSKPEIDDRIRKEISQKILEKKPEFVSLENARGYFEIRYSELNSSREILREVGYENPKEVLGECLNNLNILDLIEPNNYLRDLIKKISRKYLIYLLTSSPEKDALLKLGKLGLEGFFETAFFTDNPSVGSKSRGEAFDYVLKRFEVSPEYHVYIGDREKQDILPAKERGMKTISVWKKIPGADIFIPHINQIGDVLL